MRFIRSVFDDGKSSHQAASLLVIGYCPNMFIAQGLKKIWERPMHNRLPNERNHTRTIQKRKSPNAKSSKFVQERQKLYCLDIIGIWNLEGHAD